MSGGRNAGLLKLQESFLEEEDEDNMPKKPMTVAERMRAKREAEREKKAYERDVVQFRQRFLREKQEKQKKIEDERQRAQERAERIRRAEEAERERIEEERRTKEFWEFRVESDGTAAMQRTGTLYIGDNYTSGDTWVPHGQGEFIMGGRTIYEGHHWHGVMQGEGRYEFENGDVWHGQFRDGVMHGYGTLMCDNFTEPKEALYRHGVRVCWLKELEPGARLRFRDLEFQDHPTAVVVRRRKPYTRWQLKFDCGPQRTIDLSSYDFELDRMGAQVFVLDRSLHQNFDLFRRYKYDEDRSRPASEKISEYDENIYADETRLEIRRRREKRDTEREESERARRDRQEALARARAGQAQAENKQLIKESMEAKKLERQETAQALEAEDEHAEQRRKLLAEKQQAQREALAARRGSSSESPS